MYLDFSSDGSKNSLRETINPVFPASRQLNAAARGSTCETKERDFPCPAAMWFVPVTLAKLVMNVSNLGNLTTRAKAREYADQRAYLRLPFTLTSIILAQAEQARERNMGSEGKPKVGRSAGNSIIRFGAGVDVLITGIPEGSRLRKGKGGYYLAFRAKGSSTVKRLTNRRKSA